MNFRATIYYMLLFIESLQRSANKSKFVEKIIHKLNALSNSDSRTKITENLGIALNSRCLQVFFIK